MSGVLALIGGGEFGPLCQEFDKSLLAEAESDEVLVIPTAAAMESPDRLVAAAEQYFEDLGAKVTHLEVWHRSEGEEPAVLEKVRAARFLYLCDGSPMLLRSILKGSQFFDAIVDAFRSGAVLAASGAGATVLCDPMVDPRGGAYTVGLGLIPNFALFPYHGTAAEHLRERSLDLLPHHATLVGVDEQTALIFHDKSWKVLGAGNVTTYDPGKKATPYASGSKVPLEQKPSS